MENLIKTEPEIRAEYEKVIRSQVKTQFSIAQRAGLIAGFEWILGRAANSPSEWLDKPGGERSQVIGKVDRKVI